MFCGQRRETFLFPYNHFFGSAIFKPKDYQLVFGDLAAQRQGLAHRVAHLHCLQCLLRMKLKRHSCVTIGDFESAVYNCVLTTAQMTPLSR